MIWVRFGPIRTARIGHFALNTELYLCERDAGIRGRRTIDILYYVSEISNHQLKKMWDRTLNVLPMARALDDANRFLPWGDSHVVSMGLNGGRDPQGLLATSKPHLEFTPEEEDLAKEKLRSWGIPDGAPFICMLAREPAYLDSQFPGRDWSYHDYRNVDIQTYVAGGEWLAQQGYYVLRMGSVVSAPLITTNPRIIDYATQHRSDFMDIYLSARCAFFITSGTGLDSVAEIFRKPIIWANFVPFEYVRTWNPNDLFIPKMHWLRAERRYMQFQEVLESGAGRFTNNWQYEELGIELVDNKPEDISALALEMHQRLTGVWQVAEEDEELQWQFRALLKPSQLHGAITARAGTEFLRKNQDLLA